MSTTTRRSFLAASAAGMTGAVAAGCATERSAAAEPSAKGAYRFTREIPVEEGYDLVVAGGGPAGTAAAVCAARLGAKVLLAEATGCLGGMGTSGLVTAFDPMADGERMLVGGLMREIVAAMHQRGFLAPQVTESYYSKRYLCWTPFRPEGYKLTTSRSGSSRTRSGSTTRRWTSTSTTTRTPSTSATTPSSRRSAG